MAEIILTKENFDEEVLKSDKPVVIDFWAPWCGPCRMQTPVIEELAAEQTDIKVCKANVDDQMELAAEFNVASIPTIVIVKDGKMVKRGVGFHTKEEILELLESE